MKEPVFYWDLIQGTEEWLDIRKAMITGSVVKTFLVKGKSENGFGTGAIIELYKIIEERITGKPRETFSTKATRWGSDNELLAFDFYQRKYLTKLLTVGFVSRDSFTGCSPDALAPKIREGFEIKCFPTKHMRIIETKQYGDDEYIQCQYNLWITDYKIWNLFYYHPWLPDSCNSIRFRFSPDLVLFSRFEERTKTFNQMVEEILKKYKK